MAARMDSPHISDARGSLVHLFSVEAETFAPRIGHRARHLVGGGSPGETNPRGAASAPGDSSRHYGAGSAPDSVEDFESVGESYRGVEAP